MTLVIVLGKESRIWFSSGFQNNVAVDNDQTARPLNIVVIPAQAGIQGIKIILAAPGSGSGAGSSNPAWRILSFCESISQSERYYEKHYEWESHQLGMIRT